MSAMSAKTLIQAFNDNPIVIHRAYLKLTNDYATAAALGQVMYWHKKMNRKFYKTDSDFMNELDLSAEQFKRVKSNLKKLSFLTIKAEGIPAKTFYDVNYEILSKEVEKISLKATNIDSLGENPQTGLGENPQTGLGENPQTGLGENPQTNTENTQRIHRDNIIIIEDDVTKVFKTESEEAKKLLSQLSVQVQAQVLAVLTGMFNRKTIVNKISYLEAVIESVNKGTFRPLPEKEKPLTAAQIIAKEKKAKEESDKRAREYAERYMEQEESKLAQIEALKRSLKPQND